MSIFGSLHAASPFTTHCIITFIFAFCARVPTEECSLLGYYAVWLLLELTFWKNVSSQHDRIFGLVVRVPGC
jgi:hypothetical protein